MPKQFKKWTEEEVNILKSCEGKFIEDILKHFPYRTERSVTEKLRLSNIKYITKSRIKSKDSESIICHSCNTEKDYNDDNFDLKAKHFICRDCTRRYSQINKYKNKYGIELLPDKLFDTYTPIEWYKMFIENKINVIPWEITRCKEKYGEIIRYVIEDVVGCRTRSDFAKITLEDIKKNKIVFSTCKKVFQINTKYELIDYLYPHLNLKPFEMCQVPRNHWNKVTADEYMTYYIENIVGGIEIVNSNPSLYLTPSNIRIEHPSLYNCIYLYNIYSDFYTWVKELYPYITFKKEDIQVFLSKDNATICNSLEECNIFDYIKFDMGITQIEAIGTKRTDIYNNSKEKENYIPDFKIENVLDKPIIIEYYGLYNNRTNNVKHMKEYNDKIIRKNNFYKNNKEIYFIDLYPYDIKNNFEGVKNKIEKLMPNY